MENHAALYGQELAYDLRQEYAKIVGTHLNLVAEARLSDDYPRLFKFLKHLLVVVNHKFKNKKGEDGMTERERVKKLFSDAIAAFNKYQNVYLGTSKDPEGVTKIEEALNEIEMALYDAADEANLFGSNRKVQGL